MSDQNSDSATMKAIDEIKSFLQKLTDIVYEIKQDTVRYNRLEADFKEERLDHSKTKDRVATLENIVSKLEDYPETEDRVTEVEKQVGFVVEFRKLFIAVVTAISVLTVTSLWQTFTADKGMSKQDMKELIKALKEEKSEK